jgi:histidine triad (HIT) family protein
MSCVFCDVVERKEPGSFVYEDDEAAAFTTVRATRAGETVVIPKAHIDHFTDLPDPLAAHIMVVAQHIGRKIMTVLAPRRVGYVVHGFGVAHAHLIIVPLHDPTDITSARHATLRNGEIAFGLTGVEEWPRDALDEVARSILVEPLGE